MSLLKSRFIEMFGKLGNHHKDWKIAKFENFCEINPNKKSIENIEDSTEVSFIPMAAVSEKGEIDTSEIKTYSEVKKGFTSFSDKDVLFAKITPCMENGKGAVAEGLKNNLGFGSTEFHVLRPKQELCDSYWLYYLMSLPEFRKKAELNMKGSAGQKRVPANFLAKFEISLPPIGLQKVYIDFFNQIDKSKFLLQQILEKFELLKKSRFIELIGNIQNPKYQLVELNEICEFIKDGTHQTPIYTEDRVNGFKFLSSKDVTSQKINWSNIKYIPKELHEQLYAKLSPKRGDILLAKNGTTGVAAVVDSDEIFDIYVSLALLRPKSGVNVSYLCSALNSEDLKRQFNSSLKGIGVPNLHLREIKKARIIFPPIDIQNKISSITKQIDKSKLIIQKALEDLVGKV